MKTQFHAEAARDNKEDLDCGGERGAAGGERGDCSYWKDEGFADGGWRGSRMADVRGVGAGRRLRGTRRRRYWWRPRCSR